MLWLLVKGVNVHRWNEERPQRRSESPAWRKQALDCGAAQQPAAVAGGRHVRVVSAGYAPAAAERER
jgi:hypothetical protein